MAFVVVWRAGDSRQRGNVNEQSFSGRREAMWRYTELIEDYLTEWVSVANRTHLGGDKLIAKWDCVNGEVWYGA